jgi:radical SAM-linked protein
MYKITFNFTKKGDIRFISHLDLMRLFMRSMRRAGLPIKITEGFSPHPKFSIARALKLGVESEHEEATVVLTRPVVPQEFQRELQLQLPEGISVTHVERNFS